MLQQRKFSMSKKKFQRAELKPMKAREIFPMDCWESILSCVPEGELEAVSLVCKDFLTISNLLKHSLTVTHPRVEMLSKLLKRFRHIKKISLSHPQCDLYKFIIEIARSDVSLDVLDILRCKDISRLAQCLKELDSNKKMKNLKALNIRYDSLGDNDLEVIANSFPNLEQLIFHGESQSTNRGVKSLASKLKLLKTIHIYSSYSRISEQSLIDLSLNCGFLKDVNFNVYYNERAVTENGIGLLLRNSPNLEALAVADVHRDLQSAITIENSISYARALTSLKFYCIRFNSDILSTIAEAKLPLKKFKVNGCRVTVLGLLKILSNYQLTKFKFVGEANNENLELLFNGDVSKITHIEISTNEVITSSILYLLSTKCPSLVKITMRYADLRFLEFNNTPLPTNQKIQSLNLRYSQVTDQLAKKLPIIFPNLKSLNLSECECECGCGWGITSTGIEAILKTCKFLRKLDLETYPHGKIIETDNLGPSLVNLEYLTLSCSGIDDEGLSAIAKRCPLLLSLDLAFCFKITAEGIKEIVKNITTLKHLYLDHCDGVEDLPDLLKWMLSTGNLASLKKIQIGELQSDINIIEELGDAFLCHGCVLFYWQRKKKN